jgi:hypothetical protein
MSALHVESLLRFAIPVAPGARCTVTNCLAARAAGWPKLVPPLSKTAPGKPVREQLEDDVFLNRMLANWCPAAPEPRSTVIVNWLVAHPFGTGGRGVLVGVLDPLVVDVAGAVLVSGVLGTDESIAVAVVGAALGEGGGGALVQLASAANSAQQIATRRAAFGITLISFRPAPVWRLRAHIGANSSKLQTLWPLESQLSQRG